MQLINEERMLKEIKEQGKIGWINGKGLCRQAYGDKYKEAVSYLKDKMEEADLEVRVDGVGNIFGRLQGSDSNGKIILTGSHLDSVKEGGIYDGQYGVYAALEAVRSIKENGIKLKNSVEVVGFIAEEGGPLGGTFGSRVFSGLISENYDEEILKQFNLTNKIIKESKGNLNDYACFLETHIEQGPVLFKKKISIGIPKEIVGILRYKCTVIGAANHAGTTPMTERQDAVYETFKIVSEWVDYVKTIPNVACNVADLKIEPNQIGVVAGKTTFYIEIRSNSEKLSFQVADKLGELFRVRQIVDFEMEETVNKLPVKLSDKVVSIIDTVCGRMKSEDIDSLIMTSGASHDSASLGKVMDCGMIFVPSIDGISHSWKEKTNSRDLVKGAEVLVSSLVELDKIY